MHALLYFSIWNIILTVQKKIKDTFLLILLYLFTYLWQIRGAQKSTVSIPIYKAFASVRSSSVLGEKEKRSASLVPSPNSRSFKTLPLPFPAFHRASCLHLRPASAGLRSDSSP